VWDRVLFYAVRRAFGGRLRAVVVGAAPTSPDVLLFFRCAFACPVSALYYTSIEIFHILRRKKIN
jgi:long-subunit acyl-CoA synthetase (AMP-forming)